jgi:D-glycero-alpha-D-manno-heptose-7-phosphate kinase
MMLSRAPVRFSLGGGGTDLPSYCDEHGGFLVAAAIDKYIYVAANQLYSGGILLKYSKTEHAERVDQIQHPLFREAMKLTGVSEGVELASIADLPANSGLGSSSSFTVALLNALHAYRREFVGTEQLAREACQIEIDILKEPIGKQDQYISAYGGITAFTFEPRAAGGGVTVERVPMKTEVIEDLEMNLLVFYSGRERKASDVLSEQRKTITDNKDDAVQRMHRIKALGYETKRLLMSGTIDDYGELLHEHWMNKRKLASNMTDGTLDEHYEAARKAGAIGGKLMGAGGGGFFVFYVRPESRRQVCDAMIGRGLRPLRFRFDFDGARIIANFQRS